MAYWCYGTIAGVTSRRMLLDYAQKVLVPVDKCYDVSGLSASLLRVHTLVPVLCHCKLLGT